MGIIFKEDFETGTTTMPPVVTEGCSVEITPTNPINGVYSARCYISAQPDFTNAGFMQSISRMATIYTENLVRIDSITGALRTLIAVVGETTILNLGVDSARRLQLMYCDGVDYFTITSGTVLELGVPYKINLEVSVGVSGAIKVLLNKVEVTDLTLIGVDNSVAVGAKRVDVGAISGYNTEAVVFIDDFIISDTPLPIIYNHLSIDTTPITGVYFSLNGTEQITPYSEDLEEGSYTITMPPSVVVEGQTYLFKEWEDGVTNLQRTIDLTVDTGLTAIYELKPTHTLTIDSTPIQGIPFTIEKVS